ncbi:hypothetical protein B0T21DRAFT_48532 [Apiosordaria backusii]|uniref:Uncharacterized protein n=1 Tax=Apiosordaria backusii TaxID=314023 RepID=A0AA40E1Y6_9PEZI|nr:hypothetical protein B0T21DRAFT_48532 [Apiosordaria backusii]
MAAYGDDDSSLREYIESLPETSLSVRLVEVFKLPNQTNTISETSFTELEPLTEHLSKEAPDEQRLRVMTVTKLSGPLLRFFGTRYEMDYELWTCRFKTSDREWFAGPLLHRGARFFAHFNLSVVDFKRETTQTPREYRDSRKLGHTVYLVRLLDTESRGEKPDNRVFVLRRVSGHLRRDGNLWTFIYFPDPYIQMDDARFAPNIPGDVQHRLESWVTNLIHTDSPEPFVNDLCNDGFGMICMVLREIKTSWKLFLNEMEAFLENLQRLSIIPSTFARDLLQEKEAMNVVCTRFNALRTRTGAILDAATNLNAIKLARISQNMMEMQRKDAEIAFRQNESIRWLTIVNMVFLPATFIASVYGMNILENSKPSWSLWSFALVATILTVVTLMLAMSKFGSLAIRSVKSCFA